MTNESHCRSRLGFIGTVMLAGLVCGGVVGSAHLRAQSQSGGVELDRIVSRVQGRIITQSDIRQARAAGLVDDTSSDAATRRALENRWLMLAEIARAAPLPPPTDAELGARRAEWQAARSGAGVTAMSDAEVQLWLRDDLRIRAYLARQFGRLPEAERAKARDEWIGRLRQRAELD
jgi:hypothetical protein